jgi:ribonuclease BN (tRNA processing enzyme)
MRQVLLIPTVVAVFLLSLGGCASAAIDCKTATGVSLQILGSGGPVADDARSSSSYLIWVDGQSRILVDVGGGTFLRFGQAGAKFADLDHIAISHFHADHSADLTAILKTGYFSARERDLSISGPRAGGPFPGLDTFLEKSIGKGGAYAYLAGYLDGSGGLIRLRPVSLDASSRRTTAVIGNDSSPIRIEATGVPHGIVPALAYRVRVDNKSIVFASDQNGNDKEFVEFARDADVLVMHMAVPEDVSGAGRSLHAPPSVIGQVAESSRAKTLVLSHFMARSLRDIDANIAIVRSHYDGKTIQAFDLQCISIGD